MSMKPAKVQFNGGELSPWLEGRIDIAQYEKMAKLCRNFIPLTEGCLKRRGGSRFVAMTPEDTTLILDIVTEPPEAKVLMNNIATNRLDVARGDEVYFEVSAPNYATQSGTVCVTRDMYLKVTLVSLNQMCCLTIVPTPDTAVVKINGFERKTCLCKKNSRANYQVYKDGYKMVSSRVVMDKDKEINVTLVEDNENDGVYGDWGAPVSFVACSAAGRYDKQLKCFCIKFTNGYAFILFNAKDVMPDKDVEQVFIPVTTKGYNSVAYINGSYQAACVKRVGSSIMYYDADGVKLFGVAPLEMMTVGWQIDENKNYAAVYQTYDGVVNGGTIKIFYQGLYEWVMKGKING